MKIVIKGRPAVSGAAGVFIAPVLAKEAGTGEVVEKIVLNRTMEIFGGAIRLFIENDEFATKNKELIARVLASVFVTSRQTKMSDKSLRNQIYNVTPETKKKVTEEFRKMANNPAEFYRVN